MQGRGWVTSGGSGSEGGIVEGEGALGTAVWGVAVSGGLGGSVRGGGAAVSAAWAEGAGGEGGGGPSTCGIISMSSGGISPASMAMARRAPSVLSSR